MNEKFELIILEDAVLDIEKIRDFNEARAKGLGFKYLEDILDCLERIQNSPKEFQFYQSKELGIRRGLSLKFSIIILYDLNLEKNQVEILKVADSRQDWKE